MTAAEWAFVTIAWVFGFLPGILLGAAWGRETVRLDRVIDDGLDDLDGLYVDRGRMYRRGEHE